MSNEFVRARCDETGHIAALPKAALEMGFVTGWRAVDGPVPDGPKPAAFPEHYAPDRAGGETLPENVGGDEQPPEEKDESADTKSAEQDEE